MIPLSLAALGVTLIYLLHPPARKVLVPSTLLWEQLVEQSANRRRLLRWLLSLLLSALTVLLMVSVLFHIEPRSGTMVNPILLIDNTGSMASLAQAGGSTTRLDLARTRALNVLERSTGTITIADLAGTVGPVRVDNVADARRLINSIQLKITAEPRIPDHLSRPRGGAEGLGPILLLTDQNGLSASKDKPGELGITTIHVVATAATSLNLGITQFRLASAPPGIIHEAPTSAYLEIHNGGDLQTPGRLHLEVFSSREAIEQDGNHPAVSKLLLTRDLDIQPGTPWSAALDLQRAYDAFPHQRIAVRATVSSTDPDFLDGDMQPLDDEAWLILEARTALLRSPRDPTRGSAQPLPRWLTRVVSTSDRLFLSPSAIAPSTAGQGPVTIYQQLPESPMPPCMLLPPTLRQEDAGTRVLDLSRATLTLPGQAAVRLPWPQVIAATASEPPSPALPGAWLSGTTSRSSATDLSTIAATTVDQVSVADAGSADTVEDASSRFDLVRGPTPTQPCTTWTFDPMASQLETRAEFPVLVESVLAATAAYRLESQPNVANTNAQLVAEDWQTIADGSDASPASFLLLNNGRLIAREPLGSQATQIRPTSAPLEADQSVLTATAPTSPTSSTSGESDGQIVDQLTLSESTLQFWRWPSRAVILSLIALLLVLEVGTRFAGITE